MSKVVDPDTLDRFQVCIDPIAETVSLRGLGTQRHAMDQTGDSAGTTTFTDAGANFTTDGVIAGDILTIISDPANNGGIIGHYRVATVGTTTLTVERSIPASTSADLTYKINAKQTTGSLSPQVSDGVNGQALFSFLKEEWITLAAGLGNAQDLNKFDFPIVAITPEQFILGGTNGDAASSWRFNDSNGVEATDTEGSTRLLLRDVGWQEKNSSNVTLREYANITTLGNLDSDAQAYFQQGDATGTPTNLKLTGPVNQSILTFGPDVGPDSVATGFAISNVTKRITRNDSGNWASDNYRVGDYVTIRSAEDSGNNGSFGPITVVQDTTDGYIEIPSATFTTNASDTTAVFSVNHKFYTQLFARKKARSYTSAVHADAGIPATGLPPQVNKFPLAHASDPAITLDDGLISGGDGTTEGDIFQQTEVHTTDTDGATSAASSGTFTLTSAGATFNSTARSSVEILRPGDSLELSSGSDQGVYEIKTIDSATVITCYTEPLRTFVGSESSLTFTVRTGVLDVGATNATLADVDGDTGTLTSAGSTFDVDTALGDRVVTTGDIIEVFAGDSGVVGYYKVVSRTSATVLVLNTSDQPFGGETSQSYRVWRPGMFLQRFSSTALAASMSNGLNIDGSGNPDTLTRTGGNWATDGFTHGMAITILDAEDAGNIGTFIIDTVSASVITLIVEEAMTTNTDDDTAINSNLTGESGIVRTINSVDYPFHWRLFAHGASLGQVFQFIQRELRRTTDIDGGNATYRGDITDLLMTFASPNGVTLDMFPDNLSTSELNNVTYRDLSLDSRNNAFLVGILFDVNANLISSSSKRLVAYFTSVPSGNFGTNNAVIVDDSSSVDMDFTVISADIETTFDYTNNSQGGRTPNTDAAITVVALGDTQAQHILTTALITRVNTLVIAVGNALERNFLNP